MTIPIPQLFSNETPLPASGSCQERLRMLPRICNSPAVLIRKEASSEDVHSEAGN